MYRRSVSKDVEHVFIFFFNDTATTEIYTLSHTTLFRSSIRAKHTTLQAACLERAALTPAKRGLVDRKSTRLNSSHMPISYAVFCLKKKKIRVGLLAIENRVGDYFLGATCAAVG